jgi:hypothetical protein
MVWLCKVDELGLIFLPCCVLLFVIAPYFYLFIKNLCALVFFVLFLEIPRLTVIDLQDFFEINSVDCKLLSCPLPRQDIALLRMHAKETKTKDEDIIQVFVTLCFAFGDCLFVCLGFLLNITLNSRWQKKSTIAFSRPLLIRKPCEWKRGRKRYNSLSLFHFHFVPIFWIKFFSYTQGAAPTRPTRAVPKPAILSSIFDKWE